LTTFQYEDIEFPGLSELITKEFNIQQHRTQYTPEILSKLEEVAERLTWIRDPEGDWLTTDFTSNLIGNSPFVIATPKVCTMIQLRKDFILNSNGPVVAMYTTKVGTVNDAEVYRDTDYQFTLKYEKDGLQQPPEFLITEDHLYWIDFCF
jgi:hypothetical protein